MAIDPQVFKQVRKTLGLTQEELADALGLSRVTVNRMERGKLVTGIPDEIGERLMALNRSDVKEQVTVSFPQLADESLWDNEEDDQ